MGTSPAIHLWTVRLRNDVAKTLPLEVFTRKNSAADFFFDRSWKITGKNSKIAFCATLWGDLGVTYTVHLWLVGKRVVDFYWCWLNFFRQLSRLRRYERIFVKIVVFERGVGHFERKFQGEGGRPPTTFGVRESMCITWRCLRDSTFSRFDTVPACDRQTHRQTHRQTDRHTLMAITRAC